MSGIDAETSGVEQDPMLGMFFDVVTAELIPKIQRNEVIVVLLPDDGVPDAKIAVEFGAAVILDKPVIAVATPGAKVSDRLSAAVDTIVWLDWRNHPKQLTAALVDAMDGLAERGVL